MGRNVQLNTKEHYEMMNFFEKMFPYYRHDKEDKSMWAKGVIYEQPELNELFKVFRLGVEYGEALHR